MGVASPSSLDPTTLPRKNGKTRVIQSRRRRENARRI
jgi:hypothetical protein